MQQSDTVNYSFEITKTKLFITDINSLDIRTFIDHYGPATLSFLAYYTNVGQNIRTISFDQYKTIVKYLINYTITKYGTVNTKNQWEDTVFHTLFVQYMLKTPLLQYYDRCKERYEYMIEELLLANGDIDIKNNEGFTALDQRIDPQFSNQKQQLITFINRIFIPRKYAIEFIKSVSYHTKLPYDVSNVVLTYASIIRAYEHSNIVLDVYKSL